MSKKIGACTYYPRLLTTESFFLLTLTVSLFSPLSYYVLPAYGNDVKVYCTDIVIEEAIFPIGKFPITGHCLSTGCNDFRNSQ